MNRILIAGALVLTAPVLAQADYLYDAYDDCPESMIDKSLLYSSAEPVIGTAPMELTEVGRVGSNFLVYTGFKFHTKADLRGKLYGVRLFKERTPNGNDWEFTDVGGAGLFNDCGTGKACVFDAAKRLEDRTAPRKVFVGEPGTTTRTGEGGYTLPITDVRPIGVTDSDPSGAFLQVWAKYAALGPIDKVLPTFGTDGKWTCSDQLPSSIKSNARYCPLGVSTSDASRLRSPSVNLAKKVIYWLDGKAFETGGSRYRNSRLGDIYHSSATVVEPPGFEYKDRFYPEFRKKMAKRPTMIYVGANDGMIHAFHASPDLEMIEAGESERWQPGDEAWAYLPVNMLARTLVEVDKGSQRFFSQDLSCRFTDVQVETKYETQCTPSAGDDAYCGWRTLLLCGQGHGGSWYLGMDVTEPLSGKPKPLWEFTHMPAGSETMGMGRTWSLPSLSLLPLKNTDGKTLPRWVAVFGSGYNTKMADSNGTVRSAYRNLNLPFDGNYPDHGKGSESINDAFAYVIDVTDGKLLKLSKTIGTGAILADGTVLDLDGDGVVDVGYLSAYNGVQRLVLGRDPAAFGICKLGGLTVKGPLTGHPTAFVYKSPPGAAKHNVVLVVGAGVDSGRDPDEQANNGKGTGVSVNQFMDDKGNACPTQQAYCNLAFDFDDGSRKARLLGAPLFTRQANGDDWLLYTIWTAPHHNKVCDKDVSKATGDGHLLCMDLTLEAKDTTKPDVKSPRCKPCTGFAKGDKDYEKNTLLYKNRSQPPSAPVSADGKVYITDPTKGLEVTGIVDSTGHSPNANSNPPKQAIPARMLSWREVF